MSRKARLFFEKRTSAGERTFPLFCRTFYRGSRGKADIFLNQLIEKSAEGLLHQSVRMRQPSLRPSTNLCSRPSSNTPAPDAHLSAAANKKKAADVTVRG